MSSFCVPVTESSSIVCPTCNLPSNIPKQSTPVPFIFVGTCSHVTHCKDAKNHKKFYRCELCQERYSKRNSFSFHRSFLLRHGLSQKHTRLLSNLKHHLLTLNDRSKITYSSFDSFYDYCQTTINQPTNDQVLKCYKNNNLIHNRAHTSENVTLGFYLSQLRKGKGANYLIKYLLHNGKTFSHDDSIADSDTLFLLLLAKVTSKMNRNETAVVLSLLQYAASFDNVFIPSTTAHLRRTFTGTVY